MTHLAGSIPALPTNMGSVQGTDIAGSKILTGSSPVLSTNIAVRKAQLTFS